MRSVIRVAIAVLLLPLPIPLIIKLVDYILQSMTNNAWFPNPIPALAAVRAAADALDRAWTDAKSGLHGLVQARDEKLRLLKSALKQLMAYVQTIADANPESGDQIIRGAGFSVKKPTTHGKPDFAVKYGERSGEVILAVKRAAKRASYMWEHGTDGKTWTLLPTTLQVKTTVRNLTPGTTCSFRFRAVTKAGESDWSQDKSLMVV